MAMDFKDIDRAREISDALELERIYGGKEPERKGYIVQVEFFVPAYSEDDAKERVTDIMPDDHKSTIDIDDIIDWDILKVEEE
jgi:hypothetical protein